MMTTSAYAHTPMNKLQRPIMVSFDAFGTLFTPRDDVAKLYRNIVFNECGLDVSVDHISSNMKNTLKYMTRTYPQYGKYTLTNNADNVKSWWTQVIIGSFLPNKLDQKTIDAVYDYFGSGNAYRVYDDVLPTLSELQKHDIKVSVISNLDSRFPKILQNLKLDKYFHPNNTFLSYNMNLEKPDRRVFEYVERQMECPNGLHIHIGDEIKKDLDAADSVNGWKGVLINRDHTIQLKDKLIINDLRDILSLFTWNQK